MVAEKPGTLKFFRNGQLLVTWKEGEPVPESARRCCTTSTDPAYAKEHGESCWYSAGHCRVEYHKPES